MSIMLRLSTALAVLISIAARSTTAFAQQGDPPLDPVEAQRRSDAAAEQAARAQELARQRLRAEQEALDRKMREFLNDVPGEDEREERRREAELRRRESVQAGEFRRLDEALRGFLSGREELSQVLGSTKNLRDPGKKIQKNAAVFLTFIQRKNKERPRFDSAEFKDFSNSDLGWQALTIAETVEVGLAAFIVTEKQETVDVRFLSSLPALEKDLLRLQWIAGRLK